MPAGKFYLATKGSAHRRHSVSLSQRRQRKKNKSRNIEKRVRELEKGVEYKRKTLVNQNGSLTAQVGQLLYTGPIMARGDQQAQREGNEVALKQLKFHFQLQTAAGNPDKCRIILVKFPQNSGTVLLKNVLENVDTKTNIMLSPYKKDGRVKYQVLYDAIHSCGQQNSNGTIALKYFNIMIKMNQICQWDQDDTAQDTAAPVKNAYAIFAQSANAYVTGPMKYVFSSAAVYTDK